MKDFPHSYGARAVAEPEGPIAVSSERLPSLRTAAPAEFGGPGDQWSPETLLVAAVVDCFVLTFRAVARTSQLGWSSLECSAEGVLDRVERTTRFTRIQLRARLRVPAGTNEERARRLLERSEQSCLITNSLLAQSALEAHVEIEP